MDKSPAYQFQRLSRSNSENGTRRLVEEYPLLVRVNGHELATLVCSSHQLNFLLAGFLRLQGFVDALDDIQLMGICKEFGQAEVRLNKPLPAKLQLTLTSGCGAGISFDLPQQDLKQGHRPWRRYRSEELLQLMRDLGRKAELYKTHGGIHSAAIGDAQGLLLYAEDICRHNTLDRLAGEALFRDWDLRDKMLVTSGRISSEMVAKAARLGIGLLASRTAATNRAVELAEQTGITLVGYLRGDKLEVYSHPQQLKMGAAQQRIAGISGVILAGGESLRMGSDKALMPIQGARFIDHVYDRLASLFDEVLIVTNSPQLYADIPARKVQDIYLGRGVLAGIHSGLKHAQHEQIFVVGCDMPFIDPDVVRALCAGGATADVVIPVHAESVEPLHALYSKRCLEAITARLDAGDKRIISFFPEVLVKEVGPECWQEIDPEGRSFYNINTPDEYFQLRFTIGPVMK
jgi:FdhD protein